MRRKKRNYKKGAPHKDARLFVIVAEGEREDAYFSFFNEQNQRINVQTIPRVQNQSAPKHFLTRIEQHIKDGGWSPKDDDRLWMVLDVDRWGRKELEELQAACAQTENWFLGISNPCFEVWLLYHILEKLEDNGEKPADLKKILHTVSKGGFEINRFAKEIEQAMANAKQADTNKTGHYPDRMVTKLYELAAQMLDVLGNNWKV